MQLHISPPLTNTKIEDPSTIFSHPLTHKTFMSLCMYHKCGKATNSESIHEDQKGSYYMNIARSRMLFKRSNKHFIEDKR